MGFYQTKWDKDWKPYTNGENTKIDRTTYDTLFLNTKKNKSIFQLNIYIYILYVLPRLFLSLTKIL